MAFELDTEFSGIEIKGSYARIENFNGGKSGMSFALVYYANKKACDNGEAPFTRNQYNFIPDVSEGSLNYHKQGYEYLKKQEYFKEAIDI